MGESARIAEKYLTSKYAGRAIEPRKAYIIVASRQFTFAGRQQRQTQNTVRFVSLPWSKRMACIQREIFGTRETCIAPHGKQVPGEPLPKPPDHISFPDHL